MVWKRGKQVTRQHALSLMALSIFKRRPPFPQTVIISRYSCNFLSSSSSCDDSYSAQSGESHPVQCSALASLPSQQSGEECLYYLLLCLLRCLPHHLLQSKRRQPLVLIATASRHRRTTCMSRTQCVSSEPTNEIVRPACMHATLFLIVFYL